jgi:hypothetical protein
VEDVFNLRVSNHQFQYLIHWHGYDVNEHTWERTKHLSNAMEKLRILSTISKQAQGH